MSERFHDIAVTVNGEEIRERVEARVSLVDFLRETLSLTGTHVGCEHGLCGACTVRLDGEVVRGCLTLAVQCDGARVDTIEGVSDSGEIADLQTAFEKRNALQCGFCTPGMLLTAQELLRTWRRAEPRSDPRPHLRQLLPLHRLSGDRRRDRGGGAATRGGTLMKIADDNPSALTALDRPNSYIGRSVPRPEPRAADAGPRAVRQRRDAAAHGACGVRALAARACAHQGDRHRRGQSQPGVDCRRHRRGTCRR